MSFSYNLATDVGKVRLKIQDFDSAKLLLQDEEIQFFLDEEAGSLNLAAAACLDALAARAAALAKSESIGDYSYNSQQMAEAFRKAADRYRALESGELFERAAVGVAEQAQSIFSVEEILLNEVLKQSS